MPRKSRRNRLDAPHKPTYLSATDFAQIDAVVANTLSASNQARIRLRDQYGPELESAVSAMIPQWFGDARRAAALDETPTGNTG